LVRSPARQDDRVLPFCGDAVEDGHLTRAAEDRNSLQKAVTFLDKLIGKMWISHATQLRWTASAEFLVEGKAVAHAEQIGIFINLSTMRPVPIPAELMRIYHEAERRLRQYHH
jgi:tRNA (Thr-GGU) A37 N-methylase